MATTFSKRGQQLTADLRKEANLALLEVDRGLHSNNVNEKCEAIMKFPSLIDKFPFPVFINTVFMKLADIYYNGGQNILRQCIYHVIDRSRKHLYKLTDVDNVVKRIQAVMHSNDPIARACTLRVFGCLATLLSNQKTVHHSIYRSLDSHHELEQNSAIAAALELCQHSGEFASGICDKVSRMVQSVSSPMTLQHKLVPLLEHMHQNIHCATKVRELCVNLLTAYPSGTFILLVLRTLTRLALSTCVQIPLQIDLLLKMVKSDSRKRIRRQALMYLKVIAKASPQSWTFGNIQELIQVVEERASDGAEVKEVLDIFIIFSMSPVSHLVKDYERVMLERAADVSPPVAARASKIVCEVADLKDSSLVPLVEQTMLTVLMVHKEKMDFLSLQILFSAMTKVAFCNSSLLSSLVTTLQHLTGPSAVLCCQTIAKMAAHCTSVPTDILDVALKRIDLAGQHESLIFPLVKMFLVLCQRQEMGDMDSQSFLLSHQDGLLQRIDSLSLSNRYYVMYKIAKEATTLGFSHFAKELYAQLKTKVKCVCHIHWMTALWCITTAETKIRACSKEADTTQQISEAIEIYYMARQHLKASQNPSPFPKQYLSLRISLLEALLQLLTVCGSLYPTLQLSSPGCPAHLVTQLTNSMSVFKGLASDFQQLYSASFDADPDTLTSLRYLQNVCLSMTAALKALPTPAEKDKNIKSPSMLSPMKKGSFVGRMMSFDESLQSPSGHSLSQVCQKLSELVETFGTALLTDSISKEHVVFVISACKILLNSNFNLPKFFFGSNQRTSVQLVTEPSLPEPEPLKVQSDVLFALNVEGIISQEGLTSTRHRTPTQVEISIEQHFQKAANSEIKVHQEASSIVRNIDIQWDYFHSQFLLSFKTPGHHVMHLVLSLIDGNGSIWQTGQELTFNVISKSLI